MSSPTGIDIVKSNLRNLVRAKVAPREVIRLIHEANVEMLTEEEELKEHPIKNIKMEEEEFKSFCAHCLDGGGSIDRVIVGKKLVQDLLDGIQSPNFMTNMVHYIKSCLKMDGIIEPVGEGVRINGVAKSITKE